MTDNKVYLIQKFKWYNNEFRTVLCFEVNGGIVDKMASIVLIQHPDQSFHNLGISDLSLTDFNNMVDENSRPMVAPKLTI